MIIDAHTHMPSSGWHGCNDFFHTADIAVGYLKQREINAALFKIWKL